jgi:hypothetical protein
MSELAQELIKTRAHMHGWTIQSYPGKVKMPTDIMKPLSSAEAANKVSPLLITFLLFLRAQADGRPGTDPEDHISA